VKERDKFDEESIKRGGGVRMSEMEEAAERQAAFAVASRKSLFAGNYLAAVFGGESETMQKWKGKPKQCVLGLHDPVRVTGLTFPSC
jgi:hypothetical protein